MAMAGMKKLVVNHLEKILVTSDCATIVKELEVGRRGKGCGVVLSRCDRQAC